MLCVYENNALLLGCEEVAVDSHRTARWSLGALFAPFNDFRVNSDTTGCDDFRERLCCERVTLRGTLFDK